MANIMRLAIYSIGFYLLLATATIAGAMQVLEYDPNGNLISGQGLFYEYNDANKLVRVRQGGSDGPVISEYWYDYRGQRIKKTEHGVTTYYISKQYEERRGAAVSERTNFYFVSGQRVARKVKSGNDEAETFFYLNNHLGSADLVTDGSGALVDDMEYFPYGGVRNRGSERYGYTGKERDAITGLNYYEARYYYSSNRHFTQADSITPNVYDPQSLNRYSYVRNNPINYIDPSGHSFNPVKWIWENARDPVWSNRMASTISENDARVSRLYSGASKEQRSTMSHAVNRHFASTHESIESYERQVVDSKERVTKARNTAISAVVNLATGDMGGTALDVISLGAQLEGAMGRSYADKVDQYLGYATTVYSVGNLSKTVITGQASKSLYDGSATVFGKDVSHALKPVSFQSDAAKKIFQYGLKAVDLTGTYVDVLEMENDFR
jgi:RHS repeat-associated protein